MRDFDPPAGGDEGSNYPGEGKVVHPNRRDWPARDDPFDEDPGPDEGPHGCLLLVSALPMAILLFLARDLWWARGIATMGNPSTRGVPAWVVILAALPVLLIVRKIWWWLVAGSVIILLFLGIARLFA